MRKWKENAWLYLYSQERTARESSSLQLSNKKPTKTALREKLKVRFHDLTYIEKVTDPAKSSDSGFKESHILVRKD